MRLRSTRYCRVTGIRKILSMLSLSTQREVDAVEPTRPHILEVSSKAQVKSLVLIYHVIRNSRIMIRKSRIIFSVQLIKIFHDIIF